MSEPCPNLILHSEWNEGSSPVVFLDRDGVLNVDHGYVGDQARWEWQPGALEALCTLHCMGYRVFVVTNQSGVARGFYTVSDIERLMTWVAESVQIAGGQITATLFCPHLEACDFRKPLPGMLHYILEHWPVKTEESFLIGDSPRDIEAAEAAGIRGYLFAGGRLDAFILSVIDGSGLTIES